LQLLLLLVLLEMELLLELLLLEMLLELLNGIQGLFGLRLSGCVDLYWFVQGVAGGDVAEVFFQDHLYALSVAV
jgi:hypothetical protein